MRDCVCCIFACWGLRKMEYGRKKKERVGEGGGGGGTREREREFLTAIRRVMSKNPASSASKSLNVARASSFAALDAMKSTN